jgi:hypothetical protein
MRLRSFFLVVVQAYGCCYSIASFCVKHHHFIVLFVAASIFASDRFDMLWIELQHSQNKYSFQISAHLLVYCMYAHVHTCSHRHAHAHTHTHTRTHTYTHTQTHTHKHTHTHAGGATGCGKSTQVPQFILDEAISRGAGSSVNIVVTQPRRISALGLAQRVANERGETVSGYG